MKVLVLESRELDSNLCCCCWVTSACLTLCNPRDGSPSGSPVPGILQARTLEWVAISFSALLLTSCLTLFKFLVSKCNIYTLFTKVSFMWLVSVLVIYGLQFSDVCLWITGTLLPITLLVQKSLSMRRTALLQPDFSAWGRNLIKLAWGGLKNQFWLSMSTGYPMCYYYRWEQLLQITWCWA